MKPIRAVIAVAAAAAPLLIASEHKAARFLAALAMSTVLMKLWDLYIGGRRGHRPPVRDVLLFFGNVLSPVLRTQGSEAQPGVQANVRELLRGVAGIATVTGTAYAAMTYVDWSSLPFLVEHAVKATIGFLLGVSLFHAAAGATRLGGGYAITPTIRPLRARTPADFWRRYNRIVGTFLHEDVFRPVGGRRHPVRATLVAFAVSGLLHEYIFGVAIGRVQGFQLVFFVIQGIGVVLTMRVKPAGAAAVAGGIATVAFNILSSVFFFASCNAVVPFYEGNLPSWLQPQ